MEISPLGPWWMTRAPSPDPGPEALPARAEVAVIGGGLAGVACALYLARAGARTVVLEARDTIGAGASGRGPGLVFAATPEPPFRLLHALGPERAARLYGLSRENVALLDAETAVVHSGGLWTTIDDREPAQLAESLAALDQVGVPAALWSPAQVEAATGAEGFGPGLHLPHEALIDPAQAMADLAAAARAAGAALHVGCRVDGVDAGDDGVAVFIGDRVVRAEVVVIAAEAGASDVHAFFEDKITPVREQALATAPVDIPLTMGLRAQYGWLTLRRDAAGRLLARGARWATPSMGVGERRATPDARVQEKIEALLRARFPQAGDTPIAHRWAWIEAHSCDGLPLLGPLPGSARFLACCGFGGNAPGLAVRGARAVADGLLTGRAPGVPDWLTPQRFVP